MPSMTRPEEARLIVVPASMIGEPPIERVVKSMPTMPGERVVNCWPYKDAVGGACSESFV